MSHWGFSKRKSYLTWLFIIAALSRYWNHRIPTFLFYTTIFKVGEHFKHREPNKQRQKQATACPAKQEGLWPWRSGRPATCHLLPPLAFWLQLVIYGFFLGPELDQIMWNHWTGTGRKRPLGSGGAGVMPCWPVWAFSRVLLLVRVRFSSAEGS